MSAAIDPPRVAELMVARLLPRTAPGRVAELNEIARRIAADHGAEDLDRLTTRLAARAHHLLAVVADHVADADVAPALTRVERRLLAARELSRASPSELTDGAPPRWSRRNVARSEVLRWWRTLLDRRREGRAPSRLQFYTHVPYCRTRCGFCQFDSVIAKADDPTDSFLDALSEEVADFTAALGTITADAATIGGGTPSFLTEAQTARLLDLLVGRVFAIDGSDYFSVELNPDSTTGAKVRLFADAGVNRFSLGVQSLNAATLRAVQRGYQTEAAVREAFEAIRSADGVQLSADLLAPLPEETAGSFRDGVRTLLSLEPDQIVLYDYQPVQRRGETLERGPLGFAECVDVLLEAADARGYERVPNTGSSAIVQRRRGREFRTRYMQHPREPSSTLALGPFAESYVFGVAQYVAGPSTLGPAPYLADELTPEEEAGRYVGRHLAYGLALDDDRYAATFGVRAAETFGDELVYLEEREFLKRRRTTYEPSFPGGDEAKLHGWLFFDRGTIAQLRTAAAARELGTMPVATARAWLERAAASATLAGPFAEVEAGLSRLAGARPELHVTAGALEGLGLSGPLALDELREAGGDELAETLTQWLRGDVDARLPRVIASLVKNGTVGTLGLGITVGRATTRTLSLAFNVPSPRGLELLLDAAGHRGTPPGPRPASSLRIEAGEVPRARVGWHVPARSKAWETTSAALPSDLALILASETRLEVVRSLPGNGSTLHASRVTPRGSKELRRWLGGALPDFSRRCEEWLVDGELPAVDGLEISLAAGRPLAESLRVVLGPKRGAKRRLTSAAAGPSP